MKTPFLASNLARGFVTIAFGLPALVLMVASAVSEGFRGPFDSGGGGDFWLFLMIVVPIIELWFPSWTLFIISCFLLIIPLLLTAIFLVLSSDFPYFPIAVLTTFLLWFFVSLTGLAHQRKIDRLIRRQARQQAFKIQN